MKMSKGSCHICLEDKIYIVGNDRSKCENESCHGYICNICWNDLISNDFKSCPICRIDINENYVDKRTKNKLSIYIIILHILSLIIGFTLVTVIYLISGNSVNDYSRRINILSRLEFMGFVIIVDVVGIIFMFFIINLYLKYFR
jgi:hypothetical protein